MSLNRKVFSSGTFEVLLGLRAESYDPSLMAVKPPFIRETALVGSTTIEGKQVNSHLVMNGPVVANGFVSFTVLDNTFTVGSVEIAFGDFVLIAKLDFAIGGTVAATATNIAAAITALSPEFSARAVGAVVTILATSPANLIGFALLHRDTGMVNLGAVTPDTGFFSSGSPHVGV